ncbi:S-adenosyl-L-methionine-dependent methyltransferase [Podospora australis]|uniref:S-adenosyl-L-methionine-dependent methyltransferase n=1 Tax=Podospora australis TaxID=1536484 RepID=A0AAN7AHT5_9PEZI|nr:S-adenosyl-L-methionine-dependent methyltransferase [Podospora australis]
MEQDQVSSNSNLPVNLKSRLQSSYDATAPIYNKWTAQHSHLRLRYVDRLLQFLPEASQLPPQTDEDASTVESQSNDSPFFRSLSGKLVALELGCGSGHPVTAKLLSTNLFAKITANDLSPVQIQLGQKASDLGSDKRVGWVVGDMMALSFPDDSLDVVVGLYSLIHLPREEQLVMMQKIGKWLRPGGLVLVNFSREDEESQVMEQWLGQEEGWMFWSGFGAEKMLGFLIEKVQELEVLVGEVTREEGGADAEFLWVIGRKK